MKGLTYCFYESVKNTTEQDDFVKVYRTLMRQSAFEPQWRTYWSQITTYQHYVYPSGKVRNL